MKTQSTLVILISLSLSACAPFVVGGMAATGTAVAVDRRSTGTMVDDQTFSLKAYRELKKDKNLRRARLHVLSYNNNVLMVGQVANLAQKQQAEHLMLEMPQVRKVYNELIVGPNLSAQAQLQDSWITTQIKTKLIKASFKASRVKVVTENQVVYLLGLVAPEESALAVQMARKTPGVKEVIEIFEIPQK